MGRNNADFYNNVKTAYTEGKVTLEEAHDLYGSGGELGPGHNDMGEDYRMHDAATPFGKKERSRKTARDTHKRAGLTVDPKKGY